MNDDDPQLRARIAALGDTELARMLGVDAENYRDEALAIGREEARRRNLDLDRHAAEVRATQPFGILPVPVRSYEQFEPLDSSRLLPLWPWTLIVGASVVMEAAVVILEKPRSPYWTLGLAGVSLFGFGYFLVSVDRITELLLRASHGRFPVSRLAAVLFHLVPLVNLFGPFVWGRHVSRFAERNGRGKPIDRHVPGVLFLLSLSAFCLGATVRTIFLCAAIVYVQVSLRRNLSVPAAEDPADWGSSANS